MTNKRKWILRTAWISISAFFLINVVAIFHSYKFTHFTDNQTKKTKNPESLSSGQKIATMIFGVNNPRPKNGSFPIDEYQTIYLKSNKKIECWNIKTNHSKGTVVLFHGFGGSKSSMLDKAAIFKKLNYNTLIVDFMGSGGSEGNQTTIGYLEAAQVKSSFDYLKKNGEKNIYLFGTSMGSVAIMKSINDYDINPKGIIIECPFGSMYETVSARFETMNVPTFPMAGLLVFWGGIQNGFWAFSHKPTEYAKNINCPTLLLYGAKDKKVSKTEIDLIYKNLNGRKTMNIYSNAGHENYLAKYKNEWRNDIQKFLD